MSPTLLRNLRAIERYTRELSAASRACSFDTALYPRDYYRPMSGPAWLLKSNLYLIGVGR